MRMHLAAGVVVLACVAVAESAFAVDGVIEINQSSALEGSLDGVPGFPVRIEQPGSYRLTTNLELPTRTNAIEILSSDVTLDLNGFRLRGSGSPTAFIGVLVEENVRNAEVRNGSLSNFGNGVFVRSTTRDLRFIGLRASGNFMGMQIQSETSLVRDCTIVNNEFGMRVFPGGLVTGNIVSNNLNFGMQLQGVGWGGNVVTENNGGNANPQVVLVGSSEIASNLCGTNTSCP